MDELFKPIDSDSPFGQMMEKIKNFDFAKMVPAYPTFDYELINQKLQENIGEIDPIIPEGYFEKNQEYQQQSLEMLKSINFHPICTCYCCNLMRSQINSLLSGCAYTNPSVL